MVDVATLRLPSGSTSSTSSSPQPLGPVPRQLQPNWAVWTILALRIQNAGALLYQPAELDDTLGIDRRTTKALAPPDGPAHPWLLTGLKNGPALLRHSSPPS